MNALTIYIVEAVIVSVILGGFYFIFFKNLTIFKFNRFYLLSSMMLPFALPLLKLPIKTSAAFPNVYVLLDEVTIGVAEPVGVTEITPFPILKYLYLGLAVVLLMRIVIGTFSILSLFRKSKKTKLNGIAVYLCSQDVNPFSVFKRIVVSTDTFHDTSAMQRILLHEQTHIKQHHGIDSFMAEIICALFWFNPMLWWLKKELKSTHEYLADEKVLEHDFDLAEYFMLMLNNIVGRNVGLANNFNQSLNLKRMKMMKKKRTSRFTKVMSMAAMPFVVMFALVLCNQALDAKDSTLEKNIIQETPAVGFKDATTDEQSKGQSTASNELPKKESEKDRKPEGKVFMVVQEMPRFPDGDEALLTFLKKNVTYPAEAAKKGIQGRVYLEFVISKEGDILDVKKLKMDIKADTLSSKDEDLISLLVAEAIRVVKAMPQWIPGKQNGEAVNVSYRLPINFTLN